MDIQEHEISACAEAHHVSIDKWVREAVSGGVPVRERTLGALVSRMKKGDCIIAADISRLGRSVVSVMDLLAKCCQKNITVITIKEKYQLGDDLTSQVLAFAFSLAAQIERTLISQRIKASLDECRARGVRLGRPKGKAKKCKLMGKKEEVQRRLANGESLRQIAKKLHVTAPTISKYVKDLQNEQ